MTATGQTSADVRSTSALPPKPDINGSLVDVAEVPTTDSCSAAMMHMLHGRQYFHLLLVLEPHGKRSEFARRISGPGRPGLVQPHSSHLMVMATVNAPIEPTRQINAKTMNDSTSQPACGSSTACAQ